MNAQDTLKQKIIKNLGLVNLKGTALDDILFAYDLAKTAHTGQFRDDGTPYITHPVEGCIIMARDYGIQNPNLYITFLLHDTGEDTSVFGDRKTLPWDTFRATFLSRLSRIFGDTIAQTVLLLTKPQVNNTDFKSKSDAMNYYLRNLESISAARDFAVFGKMIDRLHNLRSLLPDNPNKIRKQIVETEEFLLPLFERVAKNITDHSGTHIEEPCLEEKFNLVIRDIKKQLAILKDT